jgi:hypothetical protein
LNCCFNLLCKLNAADGYRRCLKSLEPKHRLNATMVLLHNIVQVLAGSYPNTACYQFPLIPAP